MSRAPSFAGVILAAGQSSRMGREKALLPWRGTTILESAITMLSLECELVIVVAGENAENLRPTIYSRGAFLAINPAPQNGQLSSLQVGLTTVLDKGRDAALVTVIDCPAAEPKTVSLIRLRLLEVLDAGKWSVVPEYAGKHGHPIAVSREMIEAFLRAPFTSSARDIQNIHQQRIEYLPVEDPKVILNINTPEEYQALEKGVRSE